MPNSKGTENLPLRRSSRIAASDSPVTTANTRTRRSSASSESSVSSSVAEKGVRKKRLSLSEEREHDYHRMEKEKTPQRSTRGIRHL